MLENNKEDNTSSIPDQNISPVSQTFPGQNVDPLSVGISQDISPVESRDAKKKPLIKIIFKALVLITIISAILIVVFSVLVAYDVVPIKNFKLKSKISLIVMGIPFLPKTPEYVLAKSLAIHSDIKTGYVEASLSAEGESASEIADLFEAQSLNMVIKGSYDYRNIENPSSDMNFLLGSDLDIQTITKDKVLYVNLKEVPIGVQSLLGMFFNLTTEEYTNKWFSYDLNELQSDTKDIIEQEGPEEENTKLKREIYRNVLVEKVFKKINIEKSNIEGEDVFHLTYNTDRDGILEILEKLKDDGAFEDIKDYEDLKLSIEDFDSLETDIYVKRKDYIVKRADMLVKLKVGSVLGLSDSEPNLLSQGSDVIESDLEYLPPAGLKNDEKSSITLAFSLKTDKMGEEVSIESPYEHIPFQNFLDDIISKREDSSLMQMNETDMLMEENLEEDRLNLPNDLDSGEPDTNGDSESPFGDMF